jgi:hypothetical protein
MSISILCPTRKRRLGFLGMASSALMTSSAPLEFIVAVDQGDSETFDYTAELGSGFGISVKVVEIPTGTIYGDLHNLCAGCAKHDILMGAADDIVFRTHGWDKVVLAAFDGIPDKIAYVYPNDGHHGEVLGTHGFFHRKWYDILGYLCPPIFSVDYSDNYIMDVARGVGRAVYLDNILVEHMHWTFSKSDFDDTAREGHIRRRATDNAAIYQTAKIMIENDIVKLKGAI